MEKTFNRLPAGAAREGREPVCPVLGAFLTELITDAVFRSETGGRSEPITVEE